MAEGTEERHPPRGWSGSDWASDAGSLLEVHDLSVDYRLRKTSTRALDAVDFVLRPGRTLAIIGESGAGKSTLMRSLVGLLAATAAATGSVKFEGEELLGMSERQLRRYRGRQIAVVFQDASRSLNPSMHVDTQIEEAVRAHARISRAAARARALALLDTVRVGSPNHVSSSYPHQLTPDTRERVCIAMAIASEPKLLIVDEVLERLDAASHEAIMELLARLRDHFGMALIVIGHDLSISPAQPDEVAVLCGGRILEQGPAELIRDHPRVPYTDSLERAQHVKIREPRPTGSQASVPTSGRMALRTYLEMQREARRTLDAGRRGPEVPDRGCPFSERCPDAARQCSETPPPLKEYEYGHRWACWNPRTSPVAEP